MVKYYTAIGRTSKFTQGVMQKCTTGVLQIGTNSTLAKIVPVKFRQAINSFKKYTLAEVGFSIRVFLECLGEVAVDNNFKGFKTKDLKQRMTSTFTIRLWVLLDAQCQKQGMCALRYVRCFEMTHCNIVRKLWRNTRACYSSMIVAQEIYKNATIP